MTGGINLIHSPTVDEPFVIADKPSGLPSAPLRVGDDSVLTHLLALFPEIALVRGRKTVEGGLLHRLDTLTSGLLLVATSQSFYDRMIREQEAGKFVKTYSAECDVDYETPPAEGFPPRPQMALQCVLETRFRSWGPHGKEVRPVTEEFGPAAMKKASPGMYSTEISLDLEGERKARAECRITRGYRHQVRCHLSWLGFPVVGDCLYNPSARQSAGKGETLRFRATGLDFLGLSFRCN